MTIADAELALLHHYNYNEVFDFDKDFKTVVPVSLNENLDAAIFAAALANLETKGLVKQVGNNGKHWWVITRPLVAYPQSVDLNMTTALAISEVINAACDKFDDNKNRCDPLSIKERDIQNIVLLLNGMEKPKEEKKTDE